MAGNQSKPLSGDVALVAASIAAAFGQRPEVEAVALAGSQTSGLAEPTSDIDLYVYGRAEIPVAVRAGLIHPRAARAEINNQFWEPGDEWVEAATGISVDVMYREMGWIEDQLARVMVRHEASVGYSTAFWHNVQHSVVLYDRAGWFGTLQAQAQQTPYPEALRRAVIAKNHPLLRETISSYRQQLEKAIQRQDLVSINHRSAALLASYFDILFALNRQPHPGEKRLLTIVAQQCKVLPPNWRATVEQLLQAAAAGGPALLAAVDALVDDLDKVLVAEGLIPDPARKG